MAKASKTPKTSQAWMLQRVNALRRANRIDPAELALCRAQVAKLGQDPAKQKAAEKLADLIAALERSAADLETRRDH